MDITETEDYYVVSFFPNATEVEIDDKPENGYKAIIGEQNGEHVVMKVMYSKDRFDLNQVIELAKNIKDCPICKRLDANIAEVGNIQLMDQYTSRRSPPSLTTIDDQTTQPGMDLFSTGNPLQDLMVRMMFDTKLNTTGQVATALALDNSALLEKVMPKTIDGVVSLMANLTELSQGKGDIYRTPAEVTEFVKALREGVKQPIDDKTNKKTEMPVFRRASTIIVS